MSERYKEYEAFIAEAALAPHHARGACQRIATKMVEAFPELLLIRGHYHCPFWGPREHWWCKAPDGTIVDPTAHQFPSATRWPGAAAGSYEELPPDAKEPIGKCMNCGDYCWEGAPSSNACCTACAVALEAYYNAPFRGTL